MQIAKGENGGVLRVEGRLSIGEVAQLQETLCHRLAEMSNLVLDLSGVESCDTAALQLLYAARKTADSARSVRFVGVSSAIAETAAALGFEIGELAAANEANEAESSGI